MSTDSLLISTKQPAPSLRSRIVTAMSWVLGGHGASQALRLCSNLIMTRLLVPEMFGVMALANVLIVGLALFSDMGLRQNIVQSHRGNDPVFLNTAWTVQIIRGAFIYLLALALVFVLHFMNVSGRLPVNSVYADPILPYVIAVLSFTAFINGFESTKLATANRNLLLGLVVRVELLSLVAGLGFKITWAFVDRSIWALVGGALFVSTLKVVLTHAVLPGEKNKLCWDTDAFSDIFHFGKWVFLTSILFFLVANGDRLLLGVLVDPSTLGLYAIAFFIVNSIQQVIGKIAGSVAFPAFSEVARERLSELKQTYYKFRLPIDAITLFSAGFLFITGHLLIYLLYDARYHDSGYMIEILSLSLFMERYTLVGQCFISIGKPKLLVPLLSARFISMIVLLPTLNMLFGFEGILWAVALHRLALLPVFFYLKIKNMIFDLKRELYVLPILFIGILCGWVVKQFILIFV